MALIPCKECGRQISPTAVACPGCGAPGRGQVKAAAPKTSGCAMVAAVVAGVFLVVFISNLADESERPTPVRSSEVDCKKSLQCWGARHEIDAAVACQRAVEGAAEYQAEWTDGMLEPKFSGYGWVDQPRGILRFHGDKVKFQNGFGAWRNMAYACTYDPNTGQVVDVQVAPR